MLPLASVPLPREKEVEVLACLLSCLVAKMTEAGPQLHPAPKVALRMLV